MAIQKIELSAALNSLATQSNIDKVTGMLGSSAANISKADLATVVAGILRYSINIQAGSVNYIPFSIGLAYIGHSNTLRKEVVFLGYSNEFDVLVKNEIIGYTYGDNIQQKVCIYREENNGPLCIANNTSSDITVVIMINKV